MKFLYTIDNHLPALSWLAVLTKGSETVEISCGNAVVTTDNWFAAGVWNGDLKNGDMDTCSCCCCTGMKLTATMGGKTYNSQSFARNAIRNKGRL